LTERSAPRLASTLLHRLSAQQSEDLYDLIIERRRALFALTSNRGADEWLGLFDNPILGNSALDRLANAAHQLVIEEPSYRAKLAPKHRITDDHVVREEVVRTP
jgi:DNA replication protein DnaC